MFNQSILKMKLRTVFLLLIITVVTINCSKNIEYSEEFKIQTAGKYLFNADDIFEVYYNDNRLLLKWRGADKIEPVVLDETTFFVSDMYKKLRFVQHPDSQQWFLSIIPENETDKVTYDYPKLAEGFKTPTMHLRDKEFDKAYEGFLAIKQKDASSELISEWEFNRIGYDYLQKKDYENAIGIFKMNVALYPESDNVYDSLADAYLRSGDSLNAYTNYSKALDLNSRNRRAKKFTELYEKQKDSLKN